MRKLWIMVLASLLWVSATAADYYTVAQVMEIYAGLGLGTGATSSGSYTVRGYVTRWYSGYPNYQNGDFYIDDTADGSTSLLECFRLTAGETADQRKLEVGEYVEVNGKLKNYNGRAEIVNGTFRVMPKTFTLTLIAGVGGSVNSSVNGEYESGTKVTITATPDADYSFLQWSDGNKEATRTLTITEDITLRAEFKADFLTIADLMTIYNSLGLSSGSVSADSYTARGYVTYWKNGYPQYQNGDFFVDDYADGSTSLLECFRLTAGDAADKRKLEVGEYVEINGQLQNYYGRAEMVNGTFRVLAAPQDPGSGDCYSAYEGMKGPQILEALYEQIKDPDTVTYYNLRADKTGVDYRANGTVWDIYTDCAFASNGYCYSVDVTEECECYNREHMVPQSWWGNDNSKRMRTDLHHVIPADAVTNNKRSNNPYGEVSGTPEWSNTAGSKVGSGTYSTTVFEPADEYKGDIARVYFYMLTCYKDQNFTQHWKGQKVFTYSNGTASLTSAAKSLFLKWHRNDPVSEKEIERNNGVERLQGNRNPYVDMPELVEYIWGSNAGKAYVCEVATAVDNTVEPETRAVKILENGVLLIVLPDGTRYTATGVRLR